ncbi:hypothetical protein [Bacillus sp. LL01]|uniref:hypothetical protein n=1 Tax=Bacillus sp. LL01 TaxID=1665556 RepID=UPI000ACD2343|nr:hypothetical protein [Bacillus sp. LL01]
MTTIPYITHVTKESLFKKAHSFTIPAKHNKARKSSFRMVNTLKKKLQQAVEHANATNTTKKKTAEPHTSRRDKLKS